MCLEFCQTSEMECFTKKVNNFYPSTIFAKHSILYVWQSSEYSSGLLKLFWRGFKRDTREHLIYAKLIMVFILDLAFSPYFDSYRKYNTEANGSLTKMNSSIWCSWSFCHFLHSNVPANNVMNKSGACYFLHISN